MQAVCKSAYGSGVWFERGPLVYSYSIPAKWEKDTKRYENMNGKYPEDDNAFPCWSITPAGPFNFAVSADATISEVKTKDGVHLQIPVKPIDWELAVGKGGQLMTPELPAKPAATGPEQTIELIPYGKTEIRVTVFPVLAE